MSLRFRRSLKTSANPPASASAVADYLLAQDHLLMEPAVGTKVADRYCLLAIAGKGGMSVVYKAKDLVDKQIVAVKTLRYQWANDHSTLMRFQREAQILSLLQHPAIVRIHEYGETEKGQPFFVMDFLTGLTLAKLISRRGNLSLTTAQTIFEPIFDAVGHAHRAGLMHRDLKPGNIMLTEVAPSKYKVRIVDFGIAKFEQDIYKLTRVGETWGSPIYMSPEQCMGAQLDVRSDLYALGIVLYEALVGRPPFRGENSFETMSLQIKEKAPLIRTVRPDLFFSEELEALLAKALAKEPQQRFQSADQFKLKLDETIAELIAMKTATSFQVLVRKPHQSWGNERGATDAVKGIEAEGAATKGASGLKKLAALIKLVMAHL